jgi:phage baseplate assembly protein W
MSGLAMPYAITASARTATASPADDLANMVLQVLLTPLGARINRPSFGSRLDHMVFAGAGPELLSAIELLVRSALTEWLGDRLVVGDIKVALGEASVIITLAYAPVEGGPSVVQTVVRPLGAG